MTELLRNAATTVVRIARAACIVLGASLILLSLVTILSPLLIGLALLALAAKYAPAETMNDQSTVVAAV